MKKILVILTSLVLSIFLNCDQKKSFITSGVSQDLSNTSISQSNGGIEYGKIVFGPEVFTRSKGTPIEEVRELNLQDLKSKYHFILNNGSNSKESKATSCFVVINGDTIVFPIEIGKDVNIIEKDLILNHSNQITVRVLGKPGSFLTISILEIEEPCPCTVTDYDGNVYQTVKIGEQCWMRENLKVTHYRNGDLIANVKDINEWIGLSTGAYCDNSNNPETSNIYGRLYNWYSINDERHIAPVGWHVASDEEWKVLEIFLGIGLSEIDIFGWRGTDEADKLKEAGNLHWLEPTTPATNSSGFTALPAGYRYCYIWDDENVGRLTYFWTSQEQDTEYARMRHLHNNTSKIERYNYLKTGGLSVRCIRD